MSAAITARPRRSLRSRMLWRVLLPLAATWLIGGAASFSLAWLLAGRAFDRALLDDAYAIASNVGELNGALVLNLTPEDIQRVLYDREEREYFALYGAEGRRIAGTALLRPGTGPANGPGEFFDGLIDGAAVRIATLRGRASEPFTVVVAQTTNSRERLLRGLLVRSIAPQVVLLLLLGAYLSRQISRELVPIADLQRELGRRDSNDLDPISLRPISLDVERLRDAVNSLLARIERGVQAQREFAGNVAHELRTPLAGIRALAEYGLAHADPAAWREQLERIAASEGRASHLVDQLLALALADEARDSIRLERVRVDELVRGIVLSFMGRADAAGVDLGATGLDNAVEAWATPTLLEGVLNNLIDNALRYGRGEPVARLTVALEQGEQRVRVAVTDNGPGLEREQQGQLPLRWSQGMAGVRLGAGAGLGLAIASRYAALMGGALELGAASDGGGLRAALTLVSALPAGHDAAAAPRDPLASASTLDGGPATRSPARQR
jgi:two-component system sensor histidine kinase TctE